MSVEPAKCPNCGGGLQIPTDHSSVVCKYCGTTNQIGQLASGTAAPAVKNWMSLANAAKNAGNNKEAYDYFTRVLEHEPKNYEAWLGKAEAAGWLSTLAECRLPEMVFDAQQALKCAPDSKADLAVSTASLLNHIGIIYWKLARKHYDQYFTVASAWEDYLAHCQQVVMIHEAAHAMDQANPVYIESVIELCRNTMLGRTYFDQLARGSRGGARLKTHRMSPASYQAMLRKMNDYVAKMLRIDPSYTPPPAPSA